MKLTQVFIMLEVAVARTVGAVGFLHIFFFSMGEVVLKMYVYSIIV